MKFIRPMIVTAVFLLTMIVTAVFSLPDSPAFPQGAGIEWDRLNRETLSLLRNGQYERAVIVAKKALEVAEKNVGPNHPDVAMSLNNLAELYRTQGQYGASVTTLRSLFCYDNGKCQHIKVSL